MMIFIKHLPTDFSEEAEIIVIASARHTLTQGKDRPVSTLMLFGNTKYIEFLLCFTNVKDPFRIGELHQTRSCVISSFR